MTEPRPLTLEILRPMLPKRPVDLHKKQASVLVVAGSAQYLGAALLCARSAYRSGASLVRLALPAPLAVAAMAALPEMVVVGLGTGPSLAQDAAAEILALAAQSQAVAVGPGLGREPGTQALVRQLWQALPQAALFDADAVAAVDVAVAPGGPRVLTPHEGELKLLLGPQALEPGRNAAARTLAARSHSVGLLKGPGTLIADPHGTLNIETQGSAVLASAGSGDVLSGLISALMAQGAAPYDAACLGAWVHAQAGQRWAAKNAGRGLLASDLIDEIPSVLAQLGA